MIRRSSLKTVSQPITVPILDDTTITVICNPPIDSSIALKIPTTISNNDEDIDTMAITFPRLTLAQVHVSPPTNIIASNTVSIQRVLAPPIQQPMRRTVIMKTTSTTQRQSPPQLLTTQPLHVSPSFLNKPSELPVPQFNIPTPIDTKVVVAKPSVVAEAVVAKPVVVVAKPSVVAEVVVAKPVVVAEVVVTKPSVVAEVVVAKPSIVAEIVVAKPSVIAEVVVAKPVITSRPSDLVTLSSQKPSTLPHTMLPALSGMCCAYYYGARINGLEGMGVVQGIPHPILVFRVVSPIRV